VIRDATPTTAIVYAETPKGTGPDPYPQIFGGQHSDEFGVMKNWPWDRLQVLAPPPGEGGCKGLQPQPGGTQPPILPPLP